MGFESEHLKWKYKRFIEMEEETKMFRTSSPDWYPLLKENARYNRQNMTRAEALLWKELRTFPSPFSFRRQHVIGDYIADFVCLNKQLVIEVDGEYHNTIQQQKLDEQRTESLIKQGFQVIRFTNEQVYNEIQDVTRQIKEFIYDE